MLIPVVHQEWVEWTTNQVLPKYNKTARILPGRFAFVQKGAVAKSASFLLSYIGYNTP